MKFNKLTREDRVGMTPKSGLAAQNGVDREQGSPGEFGYHEGGICRSRGELKSISRDRLNRCLVDPLQERNQFPTDGRFHWECTRHIAFALFARTLFDGSLFRVSRCLFCGRRHLTTRLDRHWRFCRRSRFRSTRQTAAPPRPHQGDQNEQQSEKAVPHKYIIDRRIGKVNSTRRVGAPTDSGVGLGHPGTTLTLVLVSAENTPLPSAEPTEAPETRTPDRMTIDSQL